MPPGPPPTTQQVVCWESRTSSVAAGFEARVESGDTGNSLNHAGSKTIEAIYKSGGLESSQHSTGSVLIWLIACVMFFASLAMPRRSLR